MKLGAVSFFILFIVMPGICYGADVWKVHFLSVGYGDAILIQEPQGQTWFIDAGHAKDTFRIQKFLRLQNIQRISNAILTHPHDNHCGGFLGLVPRIDSDILYTNGDDRAEAGCQKVLDHWRKTQGNIHTLKAGDIIRINSKGRLRVLHPKDSSGSVNERSLVLWLEAGKTKFLFTSDIGPQQQADIIKQYPFIKHAHVVQIPHHGGLLAQGWIQEFPQAVFVISTGENLYGKPLPETIHKIDQPLYRTDQGPVIFISDGKKVQQVQN